MRQIASLEKALDAQRLAAYLVTEGISAHAEEDGEMWAIWVRDENQVASAKEKYDDFRRNPEDAKYRNVERTADSIRREEARQREEANKNVIHMGGRWKKGSARKAPLVFVLIGLSVLATIWTGFANQEREATDTLSFVKLTTLEQVGEGEERTVAMASILTGEVWRLITPIFVHANWMHLIFNMFWVYRFGTQIEDKMGTLFFGFLVLAIALISNIAQALIEYPYFFGMSGVAFGLFGYAWMKSSYAPSSGISVSRTLVVFVVIYFFLCMTDLLGAIANTAHGVGLAVGVVFGYLPVLFQSKD